MEAWERRRLEGILRRLREAPATAENEANKLVAKGDILPDESTYPYRHGWMVSSAKIAADDLASLLALAEEE